MTNIGPIDEHTACTYRKELREDGCACARKAEHGMIAWRRDHPPSNRTDAPTEQAVLAQLRRMTIPLPEGRKGKMRKCFDPEADDVAGLHRHYNTLWQPAHEEQGARQLEIAPYRRIVGLLMAIENLAGIASIGHDHNVCAVCETHNVKMNNIQMEIAAKQLLLAKAKSRCGIIVAALSVIGRGAAARVRLKLVVPVADRKSVV